MTREERSPARRFGGWRREAGTLLEFIAICGLAVAQPTFDLLGENARLLIAWRATTADAVAMALLVVLVPPFASWLVEVAVGLVIPQLRRPTHLLLLGLWAAAIVVAVVKRPLDTSTFVMTAVGVTGGALFIAMIVRFDAVRSWLRVLAIAPLAFLLLFLTASPATPVIFS